MDKALLVGLDSGKYNIEDSLNELENLAKALKIDVVEKVSQKREKPSVSTYLGTGKVKEIKQIIEMLEVNIAIFDDELSPAQIRNLEKLLDVQIIDRSFLILSIFSERAKTKTAYIEVSLAQQKYLLPRLVGMRSSLSRQGGGTYNAKGPGETKLELDRRVILKNISKLEKQLKTIEKQTFTERKQRDSSAIPIVSLVGYTNAGKSATLNSLLNYLNIDKANVFEADMLFATLDTTARKIIKKGYPAFLLTDTIGFVSRLPHAFVNSFKSTLNEVTYSDLILHVIDGSHPNKDSFEKITLNVLQELEANEIPILKVYTRLDLVNAINYNNGLLISNKTYENIDLLINKIHQLLFGNEIIVELKIPYKEHKIIHQLNNETRIINQQHYDEGTVISVKLFEKQLSDYKKYITDVFYIKDEK